MKMILAVRANRMGMVRQDRMHTKRSRDGENEKKNKRFGTTLPFRLILTAAAFLVLLAAVVFCLWDWESFSSANFLWGGFLLACFTLLLFVLFFLYLWAKGQK